MIKSLLVPFDASAASLSALSIACSISGLTHASLIGLHVSDERRLSRVPLSTALAGSIGIAPIVDAPLPPDELLSVEEKLEHEAKDLLRVFDERCAQARVAGKFVTKLGIPADTIIDAARTVDFVVVGNSGEHEGIDHGQRGLTTNALLHHTTRPVLVVPEEPEGDSRIVIAYDGSAASERVLRAAAEFAEVTQLNEVHLLTISSDSEQCERVQRLALEYLSAYDLELTRAVAQGKPAEAIVRYVDEVDASVLALGAFGQNRLTERIFGSTTSAVLKQTSAAVLLSS